jgi:flagellar protein FlbD
MAERPQTIPMIELTRLKGERMIVNGDLIRYAEASPDTVITLITGDKIVVAESLEQLIERVIAFRARLLQTAFPDGTGFSDPSHGTTIAAASGARMAGEATSPSSNSQAEQDESWRRRRRLED